MIFIRLTFLIYFTSATYLYFDRDLYNIFVNESTQIHSKIAVINAISSSSSSSPVQYELHGDTNQTFYINSSTGELILLNPLDYETIFIYKLTLEARSSSIVAPCFTELNIHVLNVNDNPPDINLVVYPSTLYKTDIIKYELNAYSTPFATINIKDLDESTKSISLLINDTEHFQIQLVRQFNNNLVSILSTKNNTHLTPQDIYYLLVIACDNDIPTLCTNQTYTFHLKSNEYLCNLSFSQQTYILDIRENLPNQTFLMHKIANQYCRDIVYSIDDKKNFYIDSSTGDLFTWTAFNRTQQSIYMLNLYVHSYAQIKIIIRILDQYGNIPFLTMKYHVVNQKTFSFVHLSNITLCRSQARVKNYFQLFSNCTIVPIEKPPLGQYLFDIELEQRINYQDTFLLELKDEDDRRLTFRHSQWIMIVPIIICILLAVGSAIGIGIIVRRGHLSKGETSPSVTYNGDHYNNHSNKADGLSTISSLKVYDDHERSLSPTSTTIYLVQKPSPPLSSLTQLRDDEGYSGSSNVSDNHSPFEPPINVTSVESIEQYHIHEFPDRSSMSPLYDVPRTQAEDTNAPRISTDVSLV